MNEERILRVFGGIDERYVEEAAATIGGAARRPRFGRKVPSALLAAVLALLLLGAGAATVFYGDSIQSWFRFQWEAVTGHAMDEGQTALLDHLSQEIGLSETVGKVMVTVDSATVGDDIFYLLIRVEGLPFRRGRSYDFRQRGMEVSPDPLDGDSGLAGFGWESHGLDASGAFPLLLKYEYASHSAFAADTRPLEVHLTLGELVRLKSGKDKLLAEGPWEFDFTIDRSRPPESVRLPDTEVTVTDEFTGATADFRLTDIELTNTGIRLRYDHADDWFAFDLRYLHVELKNGAIIDGGSGIGTPLGDSGVWQYTGHWSLPVNLEDVAALRIGDTRLEIP